MSSIRLSGLTGLRWLASLSVIFYHTNQLRSVANLPSLTWDIYLFIQASMVAVSFFFIIGGIYRSIPYWQSILLWAPMPRTKETIIHRFLRIAPAYYVALLGSFLVAWMLGRLGEHAIIQLIGGFTFLSWIHPITYFPVEMNGPLWFIPYDMMGTLLIIGLMVFLAKIPKHYIPLGIGGCALLLLGSHFTFVSLPFPEVDGVAGALFPEYNPFFFGLHFLFGVVLGGLFVATGDQSQKRGWVYDLSIAGLFVAIEMFFWHMREAGDFDGSWPRGPYFFPTVQILLSLIIIGLSRSERIGRWLDNTILAWVAKVSYGMYLWHMTVVVLVHVFLFGGRDVLTHEWLILLSVSIPISLAASYVSWRWVEMWLGGWLKQKYEAPRG